MTRSEELARRVKKAAARAGKAASEVGKTIKKQVRRRRVRRTLREAGKVAAAAGAAAVAAVVAEQGARALRRRQAGRAADQELGFEVELPTLGFDAAIERVTGALQHEGFGVLTRIDAHTTFQEKLNLTFRPYAILGACNPNLAFRALSARGDVGLLLPCNVTVEKLPDGGVRVCLADPKAMLKAGGLTKDPVLREVASEAHERIARVAEQLRRHGATPVL